MSTVLEPREVEKPFWKRWLRMSWQLLARSPVRFGVLIALLGWVDTSAVNMTYGHVIPRLWVSRLGMMLLPALFALISAAARGADDHRQTWAVLRALRHLQFWVKAAVAGTALVAFEWVTRHALLFFPDPSAKAVYSHESGALLTSFAAQTVLLVWVLGISYAPLMIFWPELSFQETRKLSQSASQMNNQSQIMYLICGVMLVGFPLTLIPAYGMTEAAMLVFMGILGYVAYRDIFERRDENLPAGVARIAIAAQVPT
jgi:hypothetical protein